jgi:isoquinoline 1-oxidoreductase
MTVDNAHEDAALIVMGPPRWIEDPALRDTAGAEARLLSMDRQGRVTAFSGKVEYGQGIRSGFALAIADELDVPVASVRVVLGDTGMVPHDRGTTGSASTRTVGAQLRRAAATARRTLISLASERWAVDAERLTTGDSQVVDGEDPGRKISYSELLQGQALTVPIPEDAAIKTPEGFELMGRDAQSTDALSRVTGQAKYSRDFAVPGMLYGRVLYPPSHGASLRELDTARAKRVLGLVSLIQEDDFVGVIGEREDIVDYALDAIRARWDEVPDLPSDWDLPDFMKRSQGETVVLREEGSLAAGFNQAEHVLESTYVVPFVSTAPMEPGAAVASWDGDSLTVWCGDRSPFGVREGLALALGVSEEQVRVITTEVGGSFGTRNTPRLACDAARLSKAAGRPVRVASSRSEEFEQSTVRPAALIEIRSGVKADGTITAWEYMAYHAGGGAFRGQRGADTLYNTPNVRVAVAGTESPLNSGSYRSLGGAVNHFAREVHIDEIAATVGMDPVELRLANLSHPRLRHALAEAAKGFSWGSRGQGTSVGFGAAIGYDAGSYVAECVELAVEGPEVKVQRVVAAFDCGLVTDPDGARNQVEGSIMMGIGTALWEAVEFDGGRVLNATFSRYRVPRITDTPEIEVMLVGDPGTPSTGAGEPAIVPIAAAIDNAVYDATKTRIRELPIVPRLPQ